MHNNNHIKDSIKIERKVEIACLEKRKKNQRLPKNQ